MRCFGCEFWEHPYLKYRDKMVLYKDFPERYEDPELPEEFREVDGAVVKYAVRCAACNQIYKGWLCDDDSWIMLPLEMRRQRLCVACFRQHAACPF